jgi:hypothetical protein
MKLEARVPPLHALASSSAASSSLMRHHPDLCV